MRRHRLGMLATLLAAPSAGCIGSCFVRGTRVLTREGLRPIEEVQKGDWVWSFNVETQATVLRRVEALIRGESSVIHRVRAGEHVIEGVTDEHPFWDVDHQRWHPAVDCAVGMALWSWWGQHEGQVARITARERIPLERPVPVFNLTVQGPEHTFFAEGLLVHNKSIVHFDTAFRPEDTGFLNADFFKDCVFAELPEGATILDFGEVELTALDPKAMQVRFLVNTELCFMDVAHLNVVTVKLDDPDGAFALSGGGSWTEETPYLLDVTFDPKAVGLAEGQIQLVAPGDNLPFLSVQLFGRGIASGKRDPAPR